MKSKKVRAPVPSAGLHLVKTIVSDDEVDAAKSQWESLRTVEKLAALRFDEPRLVARVVEIQKELCVSDFRCYALGIRGQDAVREKVGMSKFAVEGDERGQKPEAFFAKAEFVDRPDLFEYLEAELGKPLLRHAPVMQRDTWFMIFDKMPMSWGEFLRQVLTLVESAVWDVFQRSARGSQDISKDGTAGHAKDISAESEDIEALTVAIEGEVTEKKRSASAKKKTRQKRQAMLAAVDEDSSSCAASTTQVPSGLSGLVVGDDDDSVSLSSTSTARVVPRPGDNEVILQVDWSSAVPVDPTIRLETVAENTSVELEVDWSQPAEQPEETRWSVGMTDAVTGVTAEWHWVTTPYRSSLTCGNLMTHTKNTFLEIAIANSDTPSEVRRRTKSAPARERRRRRSR